MAIDLLRQLIDQVQLGQPLPFGVRGEDGRLLLAKGRRVDNESQRQILLTRGLYVDHDEARPGEGAAGTDPSKLRATLLDLCKQTTARLDLLLASLDKPAFVERCASFARAGRLNEAQRSLIHAHRQAAVDRLTAAGVADFDGLQAVLEHHERPGGGAYPNNLSEIGELASLLRMADGFMAKISPRTECPALPVRNAARQMFAEAKGSPLASAIVKEYGIYPPGSFVQLASGETAVVIWRGATAHTPVAAAVTDHHGIPVVRTTQRTTQRNTAEPSYAIKSLVPESKWVLRMPPERLYGLGQG